MIRSISEGFAPIAIVLFGMLYWQVNHWLHLQAGIGYKPTSKPGGKRQPRGERPLDRWMGPLSLAGQLPVFLGLFLVDRALVAALYTIWPSLTMLGVGWWRGRQSAAAVVWFGMHGGSMAVLQFVDDAASVRACVMDAVALPEASRVDALAFCADAARFWTNTWITISIAFGTVFGASLMTLYLVRPTEYGWRAHRQERQVLAVLYCLAASWMLLAWFLWLGLPAMEQLDRIHTLLR